MVAVRFFVVLVLLYADCRRLADGFQLSAFTDGRKKLLTAEITEKGRRENAEQGQPERTGAWPHSRGGCGYVSLGYTNTFSGAGVGETPRDWRTRS